MEYYLRSRFYNDNHPKYHKYYKEWLKNLTENQLNYFKKDYTKSIK